MANKRTRGLAIHRPILYGSTSTPLTPAEKLAAPPDHSHKWTVAVRSAASHPLPSLAAISGLSTNAGFEPGSELSAATIAAGSAPGVSSTAGAAGSTVAASTPTTPGPGATISTRGRDQEHDYHKMVGGKDDISHFIKRVQFKLHDTYAQPTRNIDKPPFSVTETGWGEFEIQIKIFFVPEANEKPITLFHHLKLHPWLNSVAAVEAQSESIPPSIPAPTETSTAGTDATSSNQTAQSLTTSGQGDSMDVDATTAEKPEGAGAVAVANGSDPSAPAASTTDANAVLAVSAPKPALPPVVHSWQYDEIVFPEPMDAFYDILTTHPPTPLPSSSAQAFADPSAYRSYQLASESQGESDKDGRPSMAIPPHPLHTPTGYLFDCLSLEAQQAEADRLELARIAAVRELERGREQLIKAEKALKEARNKINTLNAAAAAAAPPTGAPSTTPAPSAAQ
ncbi:protein AF-9 [Testicularia cyperi]|uniref:Protein AF-9 homolog n=1 Tax=Testicularia cyperi TaxID=1882483 RepID=A0A317Y0H1_9BASI|nr:protein AF-9 [Testicularia cyperi]